MNINIYIKEKIKNKNILSGIDEYLKRLSRYCKVQVKYLKKKDVIEDIIISSPYSIFISTSKDTISSEELAKNISKYGVDGISELNFFIGFDSELDYNEVYSISSFNLNDEIKAFVLIEQIYRAYRIINGEPYHK